MAQCVYCADKSGFISQVCKNCRKLINAMKELGEDFGYRALLDHLLETGVDPDRIEKFLDADPDGNGSLSQQVTARMTNQLMGALGQPTSMSGEDVKKIQKQVDSGQSFLDEPDVIVHPKAESEDNDD